MSFNRENVTWQSKNGSWNRGFYTVIEHGRFNFEDDEDDYSPEWDVDYDYDSFEWVSTGHTTEDDAHRSWDGANPGSEAFVEYNKHNAKECAQLDLMAQGQKNRAKERHSSFLRHSW